MLCSGLAKSFQMAIGDRTLAYVAPDRDILKHVVIGISKEWDAE